MPDSSAGAGLLQFHTAASAGIRTTRKTAAGGGVMDYAAAAALDLVTQHALAALDRR